MANSRSRPVYGAALGLVIAAGLVSRSSLADRLPSFIADYAGDTLWALMVFLILALVLPRARTIHLGLLTVAVAFAVEVSQLYQADWINALRDTRAGALTFGHRFLWSDLACYTVGCAIGVIGETAIRRRRHTQA